VQAFALVRGHESDRPDEDRLYRRPQPQLRPAYGVPTEVTRQTLTLRDAHLGLPLSGFSLRALNPPAF